MDDLIVIILTLVIAFAGVFGQMKKKKQANPVPGEQSNPENIWDLFKEEVFPETLQPEPEYYPGEQPESVPYENEQGYKFNAHNEGGQIINSDAKTESATKDLIREKKIGFSLRKAVIYSEILNRKYS